MKTKMKQLLLATVFAGFAMTNSQTASAQDGVWATKAPMPTGRISLGLAEAGGKLYAIGGAEVRSTCSYSHANEAYDPIANTWSPRAPMPTGRESVGVASVNGIVYAVGGGVSCGEYTATVEAYDPANDSWTAKTSLPAPRYNAIVASVNGIVYAASGWNGAYTSTLFAYDPTTDTWTTKQALPMPRADAAGASLNGILYIVGGTNPNGNILDGALFAYDPTTDQWTQKTSLPTPRANLNVTSANGFLYAIDGSFNGYSTAVEAYDPATDTWIAVTSAPTTRTASASASVNNVIYTVGGEDSVAGPFGVNESFTPNTPPPAPKFDFAGFLPPINGADANGGSFASPARAFKMGSTIPVKFTIALNAAPISTDLHSLEAIKYSDATTAASPIDAAPQGAATSGSAFRFADNQWLFNLDTKATGMSTGTWLLRARLSDTSTHSVWIQIK
jgi:N-acetylneuraminic acid mutarotase